MYLIGVLPGGDERNQKQQDGSNLCIEEASYQGPMDAHPLTPPGSASEICFTLYQLS